MLSWLKTAGRSRRAAALSSIWGTGWHVSPQPWSTWATTLQWRFQDSLVPKWLNEFLKFLTKNNCKCFTKWCEASEAVILVKSHSARLQFEVDGGLFSVLEQLFKVNWSCDLVRQIHCGNGKQSVSMTHLCYTSVWRLVRAASLTSFYWHIYILHNFHGHGNAAPDCSWVKKIHGHHHWRGNADASFTSVRRDVFAQCSTFLGLEAWWHREDAPSLWKHIWSRWEAAGADSCLARTKIKGFFSEFELKFGFRTLAATRKIPSFPPRKPTFLPFSNVPTIRTQMGKITTTK